MKKLLALCLALALCLTMLAGCGNSEPTVTDPESAGGSEAAGGETTGAQEVELWYYWETEGH